MNRNLTLLLLTLGVNYFSFGQLNYGFKVGVTQSKTSESLASVYQDMNFKGGFQVGTFLDYELLKNLNLRPALQLTQKGYEAIEGTRKAHFTGTETGL